MYFYPVLDLKVGNLPLIEAMACGTPSIYSNCSGQLEFAKGKGLPVKISHMEPAPKRRISFIP